jgi:hypothetical protein
MPWAASPWQEMERGSGANGMSRFKVRAMVAQLSAINQSSAKGFEYFIWSTSREQII